MPHRFYLSIVLAVCLGGCAASKPASLANDGKSDYVIVLSADASPSEKRGATELQSHLNQMTGAQMPIATNPDVLPAHAILVGQSKHTDSLGVRHDPAKLGPEGFVIKTVGERLVIVGGRQRGTMYGCTTFLETLGVRWYTPQVTVVPRQPTLALPTLDQRQSPAFEYRETFITEAYDKDWAARLRINGQAMRLDDSTGGKIIFYPFVHSFDQLIPQQLFGTHPEYFPLIKGQRKSGYVQRCLSNPDVLQLSIDTVKQWIKDHPEATIYSVSQNDCGDWCECDACKAIGIKYGRVYSGLYLWFVNQIAEAVEKDHPDKLIDTLAYQFTEAAPTGIVPRANVRIRLCPLAACDAHPYETCSDPATVRFMKNLHDWSKIAPTLYIWHYNANFANYLMPFPDFNQFPDSIRMYKHSGVVGVMCEGAYPPGGGGSDGELRAYVISKLLWDPTLDSDALVNEWMAGIYGPAAAPMREWFDLLHTKVRDPNLHFHIFDPPNGAYLSPDIMAKGDELFDRAQKLAAGDPRAAEFVAKARLTVRYVRLMQTPTVGPDFDSFMADVRRFKIGQIYEGAPTDEWEKAYRKAVAELQPK